MPRLVFAIALLAAVSSAAADRWKTSTSAQVHVRSEGRARRLLAPVVELTTHVETRAPEQHWVMVNASEPGQLKLALENGGIFSQPVAPGEASIVRFSGIRQILAVDLPQPVVCEGTVEQDARGLHVELELGPLRHTNYLISSRTSLTHARGHWLPLLEVRFASDETGPPLRISKLPRVIDTLGDIGGLTRGETRRLRTALRGAGRALSGSLHYWGDPNAAVVFEHAHSATRIVVPLTSERTVELPDRIMTFSAEPSDD